MGSEWDQTGSRQEIQNPSTFLYDILMLSFHLTCKKASNYRINLKKKAILIWRRFCFFLWMETERGFGWTIICSSMCGNTLLLWTETCNSSEAERFSRCAELYTTLIYTASKQTACQPISAKTNATLITQEIDYWAKLMPHTSPYSGFIHFQLMALTSVSIEKWENRIDEMTGHGLKGGWGEWLQYMGETWVKHVVAVTVEVGFPFYC